MRIITTAVLFLSFIACNSQTILTNKIPEYRYENKLSVGIQNSTANPSGAWFVVGDSATTKGFIIPRVQTPSAITTPRQGMIVYAIYDSSFYYRTLFNWIKLIGGGSSGSTLNDLGDVNTIGVGNGSTIVYEGGSWVDTLLVGNSGVSKNGNVTFQLGSQYKEGVPLLHDTYLNGDSTYNLRMQNVRFQLDTGLRKASDSIMTFGKDGNLFFVTGSDTIRGINKTGWQAGSELMLRFEDTLTIVDSSFVTGDSTAKFILPMRSNYRTYPKEIVTFFYDGTNWIMEASANIYTSDGRLRSNRTMYLDTSYFRVINGNVEVFKLDSLNNRYYIGQQLSDIYGHMNIDDGATVLNGGDPMLETTVKLKLDATNLDATLNVNGAVGLKANSNGTDRYLTIGDYLGTGNGTKVKIDDVNSRVEITGVPSGATTDSVLVWNPSSKVVGKRIFPTSSLGTQSKSAFVEFPSATDTIIMFVAPVNLTVSSVKSVCTGSSASVTFQIYHGTDRTSGTALLSSAATTTSLSTLESDSSFNDATISAGEIVWIVITSGSGNSIHYTINYTND